MLTMFTYNDIGSGRSFLKSFCMEYWSIEMTFETFIYERKTNYAVITLNRPDSLNSISWMMSKELVQVAEEISADDSVRAVIITGAGKAFCAGGDIRENMTPGAPSLSTLLGDGNPLPCFIAIANLEKPTIAAINGVALGGGSELALACDLRIAAESARFGFAEAKIGMIPAGGGTIRMPQLVGIPQAKKMIFFGDAIDAREAYRIGMVNKVVPADSLLEEAEKWATELAWLSPVALKAAKKCINISNQVPLDDAIKFEAKQAAVVRDSYDQKEGATAFLEKRQPVFKGK